MSSQLVHWGAERNHRRNIFGAPGGNGTSDCASKTVSDQMNLAASTLKSRLDTLC